MLTKEQKIRLMASRLEANCSFDSNDSVFLAQELLVVESKLYRVQYPNLIARNLIPTKNAGSGIKELGYDVMDMTGKAKIIGPKSKDIPRVDVTKDRIIHTVRPLADSYGWDYFEMEEAARAKMPLSIEKANAARRGMEQAIDDIAFLGDTTYGVPGLFSDLSILNSYVLPADGTGANSTEQKRLKNKTPDKVIRDVNEVINLVSTSTLGIFKANTLLVDLDIYTYMISTPKSEISDTTIAQFILASHPGLEIVPVVKLASLNLMCAYYKDPEVLTLEVTKEFTQLPVQIRDLESIVNCVAQIAGVFIRQPKAIAIAQGVR